MWYRYRFKTISSLSGISDITRNHVWCIISLLKIVILVDMFFHLFFKYVRESFLISCTMITNVDKAWWHCKTLSSTNYWQENIANIAQKCHLLKSRKLSDLSMRWIKLLSQSKKITYIIADIESMHDNLTHICFDMKHKCNKTWMNLLLMNYSSYMTVILHLVSCSV